MQSRSAQEAFLFPSPAAQAGNGALQVTDGKLGDGYQGAGAANHQGGLGILLIAGRGWKDLIPSSVYLVCTETAAYLPV